MYEEDVEACVITTNNQGKELLVPGRAATHNDDKWVVVHLARGEAHLPDLSVTGGSPACSGCQAQASMMPSQREAAKGCSPVSIMMQANKVESIVFVFVCGRAVSVSSCKPRPRRRKD